MHFMHGQIICLPGKPHTVQILKQNGFEGKVRDSDQKNSTVANVVRARQEERARYNLPTALRLMISHDSQKHPFHIIHGIPNIYLKHEENGGLNLPARELSGNEFLSLTRGYRCCQCCSYCSITLLVISEIRHSNYCPQSVSWSLQGSGADNSTDAGPSGITFGFWIRLLEMFWGAFSCL